VRPEAGRNTTSLIPGSAIAGGEVMAYIHLADFIPGVEPYDVATIVELEHRLSRRSGPTSSWTALPCVWIGGHFAARRQGLGS